MVQFASYLRREKLRINDLRVSGFYTDYKQKTHEKNRLLHRVEKQKNMKRRLLKILNVKQEVETRIELNKSIN